MAHAKPPGYPPWLRIIFTATVPAPAASETALPVMDDMTRFMRTVTCPWRPAVAQEARYPLTTGGQRW
jgi:hypothetical protein